jgi:4'-phosphopantetheinyl transferase
MLDWKVEMKNPRCAAPLADESLGYMPVRMSGARSWLSRPMYLSLGQDEVHVWLAFLDCMIPHLASLLQILAADEVAKAGRFHFQKDKHEYILSRGLLRNILSCYTGIPPGQLRFRYNSCGKPALTSECGGEHLEFNLSHAHGACLYAVTTGKKVGVDLEYMREDVDYPQLAERFFSPREASILALLPSDLRQKAFFTCWTRKEAYIKATGRGLSLDLQSFDVVAAHDQPAKPLQIESDSREACCWSLVDLDTAPGYVAALAIEGKACEVKLSRW